MKKTISMFLALAMMLAVLAGCGNSAGNSGNNSDVNQPAPGTDSTDTQKNETPDDTVYEITFNCVDVETTANGQIILAWEKQIEDASNGRIQFVNYWSGALASTPELLDAARNGVADVVYCQTSLYSGEIIATNVLCAPDLGLTIDENGALACYEFMTTCDEVAAEWSDFYFVGCSTNGAFTVINSKRPLLTADDFTGLRIRTNSTPTSAFMTAMGAIPMTFNVPDTYENIEKNVADGSFMDWDYFVSNRLYEVCGYAEDFGGICSTICAVIMNQDCYDRLPADLQAIIDEYSGEAFSRMAGQMKAEANAEAIQGMADNGVQIDTPSDELWAAIHTAAEAGFAAFVEEADAAGLDGQSLVDTAQDIVAKWCS